MNDDKPLFQSADYDFELFDDGSWKCWSDGVVVANGEYRRWELDVLADHLLRIDAHKSAMHINDRYGAQ